MTGTIRHFECMPLFLLDNRINRGNRDRKFDLCIKRCLEREKKSEIYEIPKERNTFENSLNPASFIWSFFPFVYVIPVKGNPFRAEPRDRLGY